MRNLVLAAFAAAIALLCPLAAFAVDANATVSDTRSGYGGQWLRVTATVTTTTTCSAGTAVIVPVNSAGSATIDLRGTFTSTHKMKTSTDGVNFSADVAVYPQGGGAGVTSLTAAGAWTIPTETLAGQQFLCVYTSAFTSTPTIVIETSPIAVTGASLSSTAGAVTVTPKGTTTATAPTGGNLTAATATSVYAGAAGICQVSVSNLSTTIAMICGQTNAVSATVGLYVPALGTYTTSWGYGGATFCFPASGTPAFATQVTVCP